MFLARLFRYGWLLFDRLRRNHGLEHATLALLEKKHPGGRMGGWSTPLGFYIYGAVDTAELRATVSEAWQRLQRGEAHLAIHPRCGTNFVVAGAAAALAAFGVFAGARNWRERGERLPLAALLCAVAIIGAQPLALSLQRRVTTNGAPAALQVIKVVRCRGNWPPAHFVATADQQSPETVA